MAQKYVVQVVDDLTGDELDRDDVAEVRFGLDGASYVIDLSKANAEQLRGMFKQYADAARRDQGTLGGGSSGRTPARAEGRKDLEQVRAWANENGHPVSSRGRVPNAVLEAYDAR